MCCVSWSPQEDGKLATLSAMGHASEGDQDLKAQSNSHKSNNFVHDFVDTVCDKTFIKLSAVNPANAYHVVGEIPNQGSVKFMIDTGAAVSLIREDVWSKISGGVVTHLSPWTGCQLVGAEGSRIQIKGVTTLVFSIAGQKVKGDFLVTNRLSSEAILGLDFLEQNQCIINAEQHTVHLRGVAVAIGTSNRQKPATAVGQLCLAAAEKTVIPPLSEVEIMAIVREKERPSNDLRHSYAYLVEAAASNKNPLIVANAIVSPPAAGSSINVPLVPIRLANPSSEGVTLHKGTKLALLSPIMESEIINGVSQEILPTDYELPADAKQALWEMVENSGEVLDDHQQQELYTLLLGFADVFAFTDNKLGRTNKLHHTIITDTRYPIRSPPRRMPAVHKEEVHKLIQDMLAREIIQPSASPWASPIVIVRKKDGSPRFCVDYRKLNAVTKKDAYPLPRIDDTLDTLSGSQWFSTLDLLSGYWQVEVAEGDREKTAFSTQSGLFEFKVMPFGLCNAPATFQRLMDLVLAGVQWSHCLVYLDDIVVVGNSFDNHLQNLSVVLQRLREANLRLKPAKCSFCKTQVAYLGHIISRQGVATDSEKTNRVSNWPTPTTALEVQKFLGLASYYRRFVKNYATIASPLHKLTERGRQFSWSNECAAAFATLKQRLVNAPVLAFPDFTQPFVLDTDASHCGIGAVLSQIIDGQEKVVAYASRTLSKAERKYCVTRKELLAMVIFIHHFRPYLLGRTFTLRTDHSALKWLQTLKEPEGQLARWLERLQEYQFEVIHRAGKNHSNADAMSRRPPCKQCNRDDCDNPNHLADENLQPNLVSDLLANSTIQEAPRLVEDNLASLPVANALPIQVNEGMRMAQLNDDTLGPILRQVEANQQPDESTLAGMGHEARQLYQQWEQLLVHNGQLCRKIEDQNGCGFHLQLVVPRAQKEVILQEVHGGMLSGHLGGNKTFKRLKERFYWPGYSSDAREWCRLCQSCAARKNPPQHRRGPLQNIRAGYPMQIVATDIMGPFPPSKSGNKYILVASDYFTRWVEAFAIPNQEAVTVAKTLTDNVFCRFSMPDQLHSDMGPQFESDIIKELSKLLQIRKTHTTPYHPQSDGLVERLNRTIISMLATIVNDVGGGWEDHLPRICFAYNTSEQESTGFTPFYLMFGRQARIPLDLMFKTPVIEARSANHYAWTLRQSLQDAYELVRKNLKTASYKQKDVYDERVHGKPYKVGDLVWLHNPAIPRGLSRKLYCPWTGPHKVVKKLGSVVYRIQDARGRRKRKVVHFNRLKPYLARNIRPEEQTVTVTNSQAKNSEQSTPVSRRPHPGTNLHIVDDAEETEHEYVLTPSGATDSSCDTASQERRYPLRTNRRRPLRYCDGAGNVADL